MQSVILDTETHDMEGNACEIAYYPVEFDSNGKLRQLPANMFNERFNPGEPMKMGAMATHHIFDEDVADKPLHTTFRLPMNINSACYIIGHNVDYDIRVLERAGIDTSQYMAICTLALSRMVWPDADSHSQSALAYMLAKDKSEVRKKLKNAHSAGTDILICGSILRHIVQKLAIKDMANLYSMSEVARIPTKMAFGKYKGAAFKDIPADYASWFCKQPDADKYVVKAFKNAGLV